MFCYRKIYQHIWTDEKFSALTGEQQRIALYILTAQVNRIGLFLFSPGKAAEELKIAPKVFNRAFLAVCKRLRWQWDGGVRVLYIPTWWKYNAPESWNNMAGNLRDLAGLPRSPLLEQFAKNTEYLSSEDLKTRFTQALTQALGKGYPHPSPQTSPNPCPDPSVTQEQEQEQEQKQEQEQEEDNAAAAPSKLSLEEIRIRWNAITGVRPCKSITGGLAIKLNSLSQSEAADFWHALFEEVRLSPFLTGRITPKNQSKTFRASLPWIIQPDNLSKTLAGNFDDSHLPRDKPGVAL